MNQCVLCLTDNKNVSNVPPFQCPYPFALCLAPSPIKRWNLCSLESFYIGSLEFGLILPSRKQQM